MVSRANDKTAIVLIERKVPHPRFIKRINKSKRFAVHDEENESNVGDIVEIKMCVPKSKAKKFESAAAESASTIAPLRAELAARRRA